LRGPGGPEHHLSAPGGAKSDRVAIIGSWPGGVGLRLSPGAEGYRPTIFEALAKAGGMLRVGIPDYRLPKDNPGPGN